MNFDPLLITFTSSRHYFTDDDIKLENDYPNDDCGFDEKEELDIPIDDELCVHPIDLSLCSKFIKFICVKEKEYYLENICDKYFNYIRFSDYPQNIINMSRTDLWNTDWAYGLMFQAFLAYELNIELPCLKKRNRKVPIIYNNKKCPKNRKFFFDKDPIYDELLRKCKLTETDSYKRKSPRDQILLHIFILDMLLHPYFKFCIIWHKKEDLTFEIKNSKVIAHIWMTIKGNDTCSYENFARGIRFKRQNNDMFTNAYQRNRRVYQLTKAAIYDYKIKRKGNDLAKELLSEAFLL